MISEDGSIAVDLPCSEVTWFSFLQLSRGVSSNQGGWNSKTHWVKRGLYRLVKDGIVASCVGQWTASSLGTKVDPSPRISDFRLAARNDDFVKNTRGASIPSGENDLNWNLSRFLNEESLRHAPREHLVTYELPLAGEKNGQLKADVVVFHRDGSVEIVELKRSGLDGADSPLMALAEGICYALQMLRCWASLRKEVAQGLPCMCEAIRAIGLILAAPSYWENCKGKGKAVSEKEASALRSIVHEVERVIRERSGFKNLRLTLTLADVVSEGRAKLRVSSLCGPENLPPNGSVVVGDTEI
jgi:hypothetical protein